MEQVFASHHLTAGIGFKAATASRCIRWFHRPQAIHPAIHLSSPHMQPCLEDLQVQRSSYPHRQPDYTSSPEPGPNPCSWIPHDLHSLSGRIGWHWVSAYIVVMEDMPSQHVQFVLHDQRWVLFTLCLSIWELLVSPPLVSSWGARG